MSQKVMVRPFPGVWGSARQAQRVPRAVEVAHQGLEEALAHLALRPLDDGAEHARLARHPGGVALGRVECAAELVDDPGIARRRPSSLALLSHYPR